MRPPAWGVRWASARSLETPWATCRATRRSAEPPRDIWFVRSTLWAASWSGDRCYRDSVQVAEPEPRTGGAIPSGASGQTTVRRLDAFSIGPRIEDRLDHRAGRFRGGRGRPSRRNRARRRYAPRLPCAGRDHGNLPERTDPRRTATTSGRPGRGAGVAGSRRIVEGTGSGVGPAEDRNSTPRLDRASIDFGRFEEEPGRSTAGAVLVHVRRDRSHPGLLSHRPYDRRGARAHPSEQGSVTAVQRTNHRHRSPGTVLLWKTR